MAFNAGSGGVSAGNWRNAVSQQAPAPPGYHGPPMEWSGDGYKARTAPPGYTWDEVKQEWVHSPTQQGAAVNEYNTAANPALNGLLSSISSTFGTGGGSGGGSSSVTPASGGTLSGSGGSSIGSGGNSNPSVGGGGYVPAIQMPDMSKAGAAAFAGAKDRAGGVARSMVDSLRGELGASGNLGGGAEVQGIKDIARDAGGVIGQASRDQAMKEADLGADFAKTGYTGAITQRGQDISAQEANARLAQEKEQEASRLAFQQESLRSQQQLQLLQLALSGIKGGGAAGGGLQY